jgi:hypothetical protein
MADQRQLPEAELPRVEFEIERDAWQVLKLEDGTRLRMKLVVFEVRRLPPPAEGQVQYQVSGRLVTIHDPPKKDTPGAKS